MSTLTVFLLDDHDIVRKGVRALLESAGDIEIVGEASTLSDARRLVPTLAPDVLVLDVELPDGSGLDLCRDLKLLSPVTHALVLTSVESEETIVAAMKAGAVGYLLKQVEGTTLLSAVRTISRGHSLVDPSLARRMIDWMGQSTEPPDELAGLTEQQLRILRLLAEGLTNREIGARLYLAEKTVKNHVTRILAKLGVQRRTQAALLASRLLS
ncbi:MAG: response regulator transcription factor [Propionibacteriales bacterium]|nr:response regulator transcription factor [Propionibacteriales bacterium]